MMRAIILTAGLAVALGACSLESSESLVTVQGIGTVEAMPDGFVMHFDIEVASASSADTLRQASEIIDAFRTQFPELDGLERADLFTPEFAIRPAYENSDCARSRRSALECRPAGYTATIEGSITGWPATSAGDAVSLATELGANQAYIHEFFVDDIEAMRVEARRRASLAGRVEAEQLADALGVRVGSVHTLQSFDPNGLARYQDGLPPTWDTEIVVTGSRIVSEPVELALEPVSVEEVVTLQFRLTVGDDG